MNWNFLRYKIHQNWNGIEKHGEENIMELEELKKIGNSIGFFKVEELNIDKIKLLPEVRQMCSTDKCHMYGRNWSCPPACGTLEECAADISVYKKGIIVQTKGELEDEFDVTIPTVEIIPSNFNSVDAIAAMVERLQEEG